MQFFKENSKIRHSSSIRTSKKEKEKDNALSFRSNIVEINTFEDEEGKKI